MTAPSKFDLTEELSSTGILVRAFIAAFVLAIFITPVDATFGQSQLTIVIFFIGLYVSFSMLRTTDRFLFLSFILIAVIFVVSLLLGGAGGFETSPAGSSGFLAILLSLLSVIIAFIWPRKRDESGHDLEVEDQVIITVGYAKTDPSSDQGEEVRARGIVTEVEEERIKVRYTDPFGELKEDWIQPNLIEKIEIKK